MDREDYDKLDHWYCPICLQKVNCFINVDVDLYNDFVNVESQATVVWRNFLQFDAEYGQQSKA